MSDPFLSCCLPPQIQLIYFLNKTSFSFQMGGSANNSGSSLLSRQNSQKTPPRVENNLARASSQPSPTINTKEAMQVFFWQDSQLDLKYLPHTFVCFPLKFRISVWLELGVRTHLLRFELRSTTQLLSNIIKIKMWEWLYIQTRSYQTLAVRSFQNTA